MAYINQLKYPHIAYPTDIDTPNSPLHEGSISRAGCGVCCLCMVAEGLTMEECIKLSVENRANLTPGTDMTVLGPVVAEKFGMSLETTDDINVLIDHLKGGGKAIANVGGDRDGTVGTFSHNGHYVAPMGFDAGEFMIWDPSMCDGKYDEPGRIGKVRVVGDVVYCSPEVLDDDAATRSPRYYLFT